MGTSSQDAGSITSIAYEVGQLKRLPPSGWLLAGLSNAESVAEHSFRVAILAYVIAHQEGANPERAAVLGLFHDLPETRIGDVPSVGKPYVQTASAHQVIIDQTAGLPRELAARIVAATDEHEGAKSPDATLEARCCRDADKLDALLQAREYQVATGNAQLQLWVTSMVDAVTTVTGQALAVAAQEVDPGTWWNGFAANFGHTSPRF